MAEWYENLVPVDASIDYAKLSAGWTAPVTLFPEPSFAPDGIQLIDTRSNSSFWDFDQSKIKAGVVDIFGSLTQAAVKTGVQAASDAINRGTKQAGYGGSFFRNFQSTQTGVEIQAGAVATKIQNWLSSPIVWLGVVVIAFVAMMMRR